GGPQAAPQLDGQGVQGEVGFHGVAGQKQDGRRHQVAGSSGGRPQALGVDLVSGEKFGKQETSHPQDQQQRKGLELKQAAEAEGLSGREAGEARDAQNGSGDIRQ